jgi:hypothetical protein
VKIQGKIALRARLDFLTPGFWALSKNIERLAIKP